MADESDAKVLNSVQDRFEVNITELPDEIDVASYSEYLIEINSFALEKWYYQCRDTMHFILEKLNFC